MNDRFGIKEELGKYVKVLTLFLIGITAALAVFFRAEQKAVGESTQNNISEHMDRQAYHLYLVLDTHYQYLEAVAARVAERDELLATGNRTLLRLIHEYTVLERLALIDPDGIATYDNGVQKYVGERRYFREAISGQRTMSDPLESMIDGTTRVILGVPIWKDDEILGILGGSFNVTALSNMLFEDIYGGAGQCFLVSEEGVLISCDNRDLQQAIMESENFFAYYAEMTDWSGASPEEIRQDFQAQIKGNTRFCAKDAPSERNYLSYTPLGMNGWMLCYIVPEEVAQEDYAFIRIYERYLTMVLIILVILLFAVLRISDKRQRVLLKYAQTDALTRAANKQSTEDKIEAWLQSYGQTGIHAFLMLDIDKFKNINDTVGHVAGDEVLRQVGSLLQRYFRSDDIIGRIGGDEFVVFMKHAGSKEQVCSRVKRLGQLFREMEIEGINFPITCSIGVSFAPENGTSYMELYKYADAALYQMKKSGRDGYAVYGEE